MNRALCTMSWLLASVICLSWWPSPARADDPLSLELGQLYLVFDPRLNGVADHCELLSFE